MLSNIIIIRNIRYGFCVIFRQRIYQNIIRWSMINIIKECNFQTKEISEMDIRAIFRMIDVDKSGNISRTVRKELFRFDNNDEADG